MLFLRSCFASGSWGHPPDPLEVGPEEIRARVSVPKHKFRAIAKSGFDIMSKPSSIGRIYWHQATSAVK